MTEKFKRRSSAGLRNTLFETMDKLQKGEITPRHANATANLAAQIVDTVRLELEAEAQHERLGNRAEILPPDLLLVEQTNEERAIDDINTGAVDVAPKDIENG